jgi:hypothetical protein
VGGLGEFVDLDVGVVVADLVAGEGSRWLSKPRKLRSGPPSVVLWGGLGVGVGGAAGGCRRRNVGVRRAAWATVRLPPHRRPNFLLDAIGGTPKRPLNNHRDGTTDRRVANSFAGTISVAETPAVEL